MRKLLLLMSIFLIIVIFLSLPDKLTGENKTTKVKEEYIYEKILSIGFGKVDSLLGLSDPKVQPGDPDIPAYAPDGPRDVICTLNGDIYIVDVVKERIVKYDSKGHYLGQVCIVDTPITFTTSSGRQIKFSELKGGSIEVDKYGNLYVVSDDDVYIFNSRGKLKTIVDKFNGLENIGARVISMSFGDGVLVATGGFSDHLGRRIEVFPDGSTGKIGFPFWRDYQGNLYEIPDSMVIKRAKGEIPPNYRYRIIIKTDKDRRQKTVFPKDLTKDKGYLHLYGLDEKGNLYFSMSSGIEKYDFNGNLLAVITKNKLKRYGLIGVMFGTKPRVLANGDIINAYCASDGFHIFRHRLIK